MTLNELSDEIAAKWIAIGVVRPYDIKTADRAKTRALHEIQSDAASCDPSDQPLIDALHERVLAILDN